MLHSIYDLTTYCRKTTGDVPAKLVGASTTVVGSKLYLFGGRLVTERRMVSDLYVFDLETFVWDRVHIHPEDDVPQARYFHSADTWGNRLIIFGGMSNQPDSPNPDDLCVLSDVRVFDISTGHWLPASPISPASEMFIPRARYAHLSSITSNRLFIIGGQDFNNTWLDDICVYDLVSCAWVQRHEYPRHCGTYRSVAVSSTTTVRLPQEERRSAPPFASLGGPPGQRFGSDKNSSARLEPTPTDSLIHLPYSAEPNDDYPSDIYLYSNYNFTDVKRELEVFSPLPDSSFAIHDKSAAMAGTTFPPGLRFPTGALLGTHLIIAGTYLAHSYQSFSIWVLDLLSMTWSRIDPGKAIESGSWFRGCLHTAQNKFLIFGNKHGNLVDDYNRRLLSWDYVAVVDLEAFGIYQPPPLKLDIPMQELGLSALEEGLLADFEILCDDGRRLSCSRRILEERWPWFAEEQRRFLTSAKKATDALPASAMDVDLPEVSGTVSVAGEGRPDPRLTPRAFHLSEPYPITLALLQYFYTLALVTPLQHAPAVLSQLLMLASNYKIGHLMILVKHAMHRALSNSTSVGVYEVATLCSCRSLQIRALKTVMSYTQRRPSRTKGDRDGGSRGGKPPSSGGRPPSSGGGGGPSGTESQNQYVSRPRGTSDARFRMMSDASGSGSGYNTRSQLSESSTFLSNNDDLHSITLVEATTPPADPPEDDQITPLPDLSLMSPARSRSTRRSSRPTSAVSVRTEGEIASLADFMSSSISRSRSSYFEDPTDPNPLFTTRKNNRITSPPNSAPSRANFTPPRVLPRSHSESELRYRHRRDSHSPASSSDHTVLAHCRPTSRPPTAPSRSVRQLRMSTDSITGPAPSLMSISTSSYAYTSPGPNTPSVSPMELTSPLSEHLPSVAKRRSDEPSLLDLYHHHQDACPSSPSDNDPFLGSSPHTSWPHQKPETHWIDPKNMVLNNESHESFQSTQESTQHFLLDSQQLAAFPAPPVPPKNPETRPPQEPKTSGLSSPTASIKEKWEGGSQLTLIASNTTSVASRAPSFAWFFKKEPKEPMSEAQRMKSEAKRVKKEEVKAKREQMRTEKAKRELDVMSPMMGGMAF